MIILSFNIRARINFRNKPYKLIEYLRNFDLVLLQEVVNIKPRNIELISKELNVQIYSDKVLKQKQNIGVAALVNKNSEIAVNTVEYPKVIGEGRLQHLDISYKEHQLNVINIYGNTNASIKKHQWGKLHSYICKIPNLMIIGDFNSTITQDERMGNTGNYHMDRLLIDLMERTNLTDMANFVDNKTHTWIGNEATSLIDRILTCKTFLKHTIQYNNIICPFSDHNTIGINMLKKNGF